MHKRKEDANRKKRPNIKRRNYMLKRKFRRDYFDCGNRAMRVKRQTRVMEKGKSAETKRAEANHHTNKVLLFFKSR